MKNLLIILFAVVVSQGFAQTKGELQTFYNSFSLPDSVYQKAGTDSVFERKNGVVIFRFLVASGGITQSTLNDSTDAVRITINTKLATNGNGSSLTGLTKTQVGLSNVDNTSDADKPVSTATQTALNGKLATNGNGSSLTGLTKTQVGLGNVDNTSDADKPVSTATQTALNGKLATNGNGSSLTGLTKTQVGLGNVDNTSDADKPVSTATQTALNNKQATLVSGTSIKTINGSPLLGSGDLVVGGAPTFLNLASAFSSTSVTPATVTGWSFAVTTGKTYRIEVIADYQTAATTTGGILGISLTTAAGSVRGYAMGTVVNTAAASELTIPIRTTSGAGSSLTTTGVTAINSPHSIYMLITFTCTTSGTFNIQWATEVAASAAQLNANSTLLYQALN